MRPADIEPHEAAEVLWHFGNPGYEPGTFNRLLISTMSAADSENLAKLGAAFPGYAAAVHMAQRERHGLDRLTRIAEGTQQ